MKKIKLKEGEIYQKKGTLDVRTIYRGDCYLDMGYRDIGGESHLTNTKSFRQWIRRNKGSKNEVKLIGHYDFDKQKARVVKCIK